MAIVGQWRNTIIKIVSQSNKDKQSVNTWAANDGPALKNNFKIKVISAIFNADGTYRSAYKSLEGNAIANPSGTWIATDDSLFLKQTSPLNNLYKFKLNIRDSLAIIKGMIDLNLDGKADAELYCELKKCR